MMRTSHQREQRLTQDADQAELHSIIDGAAVVDVGMRDEQIAGSLDDHEYMDDGKLLRSQKEDLALDSFAGGIHGELAWRSECLKSVYPFKLEKNSLLYQGQGGGLYELLLLMTVSADIAKQSRDAIKLFERIAGKVVAAHFGPHAQSFHTGFPRDGGISFKDKLEEIHKATGEFFNSAQSGFIAHATKDDGVDFVICLEHADKRKIGQLFVLGQCACGDHWTPKLGDLKIEKIRRWLHPLTISPVKAFAVPRHIVDNVLKDSSLSAGLVFDRARLALTLAHANPDVLGEGIRKEIKTLTKQLLDEYR